LAISFTIPKRITMRFHRPNARRFLAFPGLKNLAFLALASAAVLMWRLPALAESGAVVVPAPALDEPAAAAPAEETAILAGGCFWGVQGVFQHVAGVTNAVSGYSGGARAMARYPIVSGGDTGHAESVQITFDPRKVSYGKLLQIYFSVVQDPTLLNRQGPDEGTQYRSAIFPQSDAQKQVSEAYIAQLDKAGVFHKPIVTAVEPFKGFFPAEDYHQNYLTLNPRALYIVYNDLPKVEALKKLFPALYRDQPVLVQTASY
jgi:peptide-methionine (S)-S-oxide reductase